MKEAAITYRTEGDVGFICLNRPEKSNAITLEMCRLLRQAVQALNANNVRVIVLSGAGASFSSGLDTSLFTTLLPSSSSADRDPVRKRLHFKDMLMNELQAAVNALEKSKAPLLALVHGACVGAGVDLIAASDIRYCTASALFSVKEVDVSIIADMGSLQRLPSIIGHGATMDLSLTARTLGAEEALKLGLVSQIFQDLSTMQSKCCDIANAIAAKSPVAVQGTKHILLHQRDNPNVPQGLDYVATYNAAMLVEGADLQESLNSRNRKPVFAKL